MFGYGARHRHCWWRAPRFHPFVGACGERRCEFRLCRSASRLASFTPWCSSFTVRPATLFGSGAVFAETIGSFLSRLWANPGWCIYRGGAGFRDWFRVLRARAPGSIDILVDRSVRAAPTRGGSAVPGSSLARAQSGGFRAHRERYVFSCLARCRSEPGRYSQERKGPSGRTAEQRVSRSMARPPGVTWLRASRRSGLCFGPARMAECELDPANR